MSIRPCAQYGIAIGHLMSTLERLESSPQPHPPAVVQAITSTTEALRQVELAYGECVENHPSPAPLPRK
jgi:hypothetical protein